MSKRRPIPDAERTATMLDLLSRLHPHTGMSMSHVMVEEASPGTGFRAVQRYADAVILGVWPSSGFTLDGYEVKASKADLKRELAQPEKWCGVGRFCDTWTLVAWNEDVLVDGIPESWGIEVVDGVDGEHSLRTVRKPTKLAREAWTQDFICSLVRNAHQQAPSGALLARVAINAQVIAQGQKRSEIRQEVNEILRPIKHAIYGRDSWKWPLEANDNGAVIKRATERLLQGELSPDATHAH